MSKKTKDKEAENKLSLPYISVIILIAAFIFILSSWGNITGAIISITGKTTDCVGCIHPTTDKCVEWGTRVRADNFEDVSVDQYCDATVENWAEQKELELTCQNDYECISNTCADGECTALAPVINLIWRIWCYIAYMFDGSEAIQSCIDSPYSE